MSQEKTVTSVLETKAVTEIGVNDGAVFVNNIPESLQELDSELYNGFALQSEFANETDFRQDYLLKSIIAANKSKARQNVALYDRSIDAMAKLPVYKRSHTRDQVEQIFLETRDGKILAEIRKMSAEYLENHK